MKIYVCVAFFCLMVSASMVGQDSGQITGTAYDATGAIIAGADVEVSSPERGIYRTTQTNGSGDYLIGGLPAGIFNLKISAQSFKTFSVTGIVLRVAQNLRADARLQVESSAAETDVQGSGVGQVETQSSELSGVITGKQIAQLQLNGRNFTQLVTMTPGVSNQTGQDEGTVGIFGSVAFSFNGGRTQYNNWELDGGDVMDNGSNETLNVYPSVDAIAEVTVLTSNYGAQYGRNGSGTVEVETKSGTSSFHGDVYEFVRNTAFNARNYFQSNVPSYHKNDFGYTIGGPIFVPKSFNTQKQKTFFFWSEEWRKESVPGQIFNAPVPSEQERLGNFNDLCPSGNQPIPSFPDCPIDPATGLYFPQNQVPIAPAGAALLPLIPVPNAGAPGAAIYNASPPQPTNWREELVRLDQNVGSKMRAMVRYAHDSWDTITPSPAFSFSLFPTVQTRFIGPGVSFAARLNWDLSKSTVNEFVFSYTSDHITLASTGTPDPTAWQRPQELPIGAIFDNGFGGKLPAIVLIGGAPYGGILAQDPNGQWPEGPFNSNPTYTYRDNVSRIVGPHNLQFGAYFAAAQKNELSTQQVNGSLKFSAFDVAVTTHNAFADLLMGRIASFRQASTNVKFYNRYKILEPYLQDDWHVTSRLTVNVGMRISLFGTYREKDHRAYNWDPRTYDVATAPQIDVTGAVTGFRGSLIPGTGNPFDGLVQCGAAGVPAGCMTGHLFNPAPRIGFALDPLGTGKMALRGAYGIFFEHTNGNEATTESLEGQSSPLIQTVTQYNIIGYKNIGAGASASSPQYPLSFISIPSKAIWPYVQQWHLDVQQALAGSVLITVSYVGSKGTHLTQQDDLNQVLPVADSENPYKVGEPIGGINNAHDDCGTNTTPSGVAVVGQAAVNLAIACGGDPNPQRPFYGIGSIMRLASAASSTYNAFQFSARRYAGALQLNLAYTLGHSIDDASDRFDFSLVNTYDPAAHRASSQFDARHMLNLNWIYDLPHFRQKGLKNHVLGGWQYSGILTFVTGTPYSAVNAADYPDNAGVGNNIGTSSYPDRVGNPSRDIPDVPLPGYGPLNSNPGAFAAPRGLTFGNAGRNTLRSPDSINFNMALYKAIHVTERVHFEFRTEAFNIFNHTEWGSPSAFMGCYGGPNNSAGNAGCVQNSTFLRIGSAHPARVLQLGMKLIF